MNTENPSLLNFKMPSINIPSINQEDFRIDPFANYTPHTVLILGNGFDLDLGMKTSYKDFASSVSWPFKDQENIHTLPGYLNTHCRNTETWFDLEEELSLYAQKNKDNSDTSVKEDVENLNILTKSLSSYLQNQEDHFIEKLRANHKTKSMTSAHFVLDSILQKPSFSIYTFNYTDIYKIANELILNEYENFSKIQHIHGSIESSDVILGAGDCKELNDKYFQFYKSANPTYKSTNLVDELSKADEVYIFGHSLGQNDHDYFLDFFKRATQDRKFPFSPHKIKLRIFTKDSRSEINLKRQLMNLTGKHLIGLFAHCDFKILKTDRNERNEWMNEWMDEWKNEGMNEL